VVGLALCFDPANFYGIMVAVREDRERAVHVGVNAHLLSLDMSYRSAGINWYIYNLLQHLPDADPGVGYTVFLRELGYPGKATLDLQHTRLPTHRPSVRILWEQVVQPWAARHSGLHLLHCPAFVGPLWASTPFVVTVHDLSFLLFPEGFRGGNRIYLRTLTGLSVRRARRVIAVSESTRQDLVRLYGLAPHRVDVVHNGMDAAFRPLPAGEVEAFRSRKGLPERFLLFVGTLEPRKNIVRLVEAYAQLPMPRIPLMLVGGKGWFYEEISVRVEELDLADEVRFVGYIPAEELPWWYNAAEALAYPSLYEGFGLPALEAMACGTPVVTSRTSSLPEVVGEAGMLVEPTDVAALAGALQHVLEDGELREQMRTAGLAQAASFSWQRTARETVKCYRRALAGQAGSDRV
jgi:glycosyltransferase involved in cell wall biosynthesis